MIVMSLMFAIGMAAYSTVDTQTRQSGVERQQESSFNLTEGAVQEQSYVLSARWPGNAAKAAPQACTETGPVGAGVALSCPAPDSLANGTGGGNFTLADFKNGTNWRTEIRDNLTGTQSDVYTSAVRTQPCPSQTEAWCSWDANGDDKLWVRASGTVRGKQRTLVALLKREKLTEPFPRNAVTAGSLQTTNNGNKVMLDATGSQVVVRCSGAQGSSCLDYRDGQIAPANATVNNPGLPPAMSAQQIERFKAVAETANPPTYYTTCPASLAGRVVFIDPPANSTPNCTYTSNPTWNSLANPGIVIMTRGTMELGGTVTFYGIMYMVNGQNSSGTVYTSQGNAHVFGSVAVDGPGNVAVGSSGNTANISYRNLNYSTLQTYGTAGLVQNTWREVPPGS